jgi:hypothetical protein
MVVEEIGGRTIAANRLIDTALVPKKRTEISSYFDPGHGDPDSYVDK